MEEKVKSKFESIVNGISTAIAMLSGSYYLYINPGIFGNDLISYMIGVLFGVIGLGGFLTEVAKMNERLKPYIKNAGGILLIILLIIILNYVFSNIIVNSIIFFLYILCVYGSSNILINIGYILITENTSFKKVLLRGPVFVLNILIFILTIMQILQIVKII